MTIEKQLRRTWKQERRFCHIRGICRSVIWLAMLLFLGLVIDWGLLFKIRTPATVSLLLGCTGLIIMVWVIWRYWLKLLQPYDATRIALEVEARHPELMSSLVSYTQMNDMTSRSEASPELLEAMRNFAVQQSNKLKFSDIIDFSQLKKLLACAVIILAAAAGLSVNWSEYVSVLVKRLAGIDTSYPIRTQLVDISGDMIVPFGRTAEVSVTAGGVIPDDAILHVKPTQGQNADWAELPMEKLANGLTFARELDSADRNMQYYVTMGDYQSESFQITVVRSPRIVKAEVQLQFPAYLKRPPEITDQLNLEVPEGTRIDWRLRCDKAVGKLGVVCGDKRIEAQVGKSGKDVSFSLIADKKIAYTFEWTENTSGENFQFKDVEYSVKAIKDAKPRIVFRGKVANGLATMGKKALIGWQAQDDYGLGETWLVYTLTTPGQPETPKEQRILLKDAKGRLSAESSHTWTLAKDVPDLKPGRKIIYHLETTDLKPDKKGQRIARSPVRNISIVSNEEYILWYRRELTEHNEVVKGAFISERNASKQIKQLLSENGKDKP